MYAGHEGYAWGLEVSHRVVLWLPEVVDAWLVEMKANGKGCEGTVWW